MYLQILTVLLFSSILPLICFSSNSPLQVNTNCEGIYLISNFGNVHLYDKETGTCIYIKCICRKVIFVTDASSCTICVNKKGQVCQLSAACSSYIVVTRMWQSRVEIERHSLAVLPHSKPYSSELSLRAVLMHRLIIYSLQV